MPEKNVGVADSEDTAGVSLSQPNLEQSGRISSSQHDIPFYDFLSEESVKNGKVEMIILRDIHATIKFNSSPQGSMSDGGPIYFMATPVKAWPEAFTLEDDITVKERWNGDFKLAICTDYENYKFPSWVHNTAWIKANIKGNIQ